MTQPPLPGAGLGSCAGDHGRHLWTDALAPAPHVAQAQPVVPVPLRPLVPVSRTSQANLTPNLTLPVKWGEFLAAPCKLSLFIWCVWHAS